MSHRVLVRRKKKERATTVPQSFDKKFFLIAVCLILSATAVVCKNYHDFIELRTLQPRFELHQEILKGEAQSPYNYRVFVPFCVDALAKALTETFSMNYIKAWVLSYLIYDYISLSLFLITLFIFLKEIHSTEVSLIGTLFCAVLLPMSLRDHYFQPWSLIEAFLFCAAIYATLKKHLLLLIVITIIASLNRVTGLFIAFVYLLGTLKIRTLLKRDDLDIYNVIGCFAKFAGLLAISIGIAISLRLMRGGTGHVDQAWMWKLWKSNTSATGFYIAAKHILFFAGIGWVFAILGIKRANSFMRQEALIIPLYLVPVILFGVWKEVRMLMPLYPIIISLSLSFIERYLAEPHKSL
jgi:hypothetical protein